MARTKKTTTKKTTKKTKKSDDVKVKKPRAPKKEKVAKPVKEPKVPENRILLEEPNLKEINFKEDYVGEKSGAYIKRMLELNSLTNAEIIEAVQKQFPESKVGNSDIGFHRLQLKKAGTPTQVVRIDAKGQRYTLGI